jgi:non-ribosomal peptide synthetase component F
MQGIWSYLLHEYTRSEVVSYGVVVSGRPEEMQGVEQRVGMFINTIPLRSKLNGHEETSKWLETIQLEQLSSRNYQYTPLQVIQSLTGVQGDLFDTLLVFENYPVSKVIAEKKWSLRVEKANVKEQTNYPLTLLIGSADQIYVGFSYNSQILKSEAVETIKNHFNNVLLQIIDNTAKQVSKINLVTASEQLTP